MSFELPSRLPALAPVWRWGLASLALVSLAACGPGTAGKGAGPGQMPPTPVGVITVQATTVGLTSELPGRLEALRTAQVRAQVTGIVQKRLFTEGAKVKAHQPLFQIDPAPYRAAFDSAQANQAKADAALALATATLERNRPLAEARAISQQDWLSTQAAYKQALADLAVSKAAAVQARLSLDHAAVSSPISGRIGRAEVTEGALVSASQATLLATVQQVDKLYVNITQPASDALRLKREIQSGRLQAAASAQVQLVLEDGTVYAHPAKLLFTDLSVDPSSGQVTLRAEVPNPEGDLLPGLYVRVRVPTAQSKAALLVPQQAVTRGSSGDSVLVVGADHQVSPRQVQLGGANDGQWVVLAGLKVGEQVVVDGFQKIRPKAPVTPVPWTPAAPRGASAPAADPASAASR